MTVWKKTVVKTNIIFRPFWNVTSPTQKVKIQFLSIEWFSSEEVPNYSVIEVFKLLNVERKDFWNLKVTFFGSSSWQVSAMKKKHTRQKLTARLAARTFKEQWVCAIFFWPKLPCPMVFTKTYASRKFSWKIGFSFLEKLIEKNHWQQLKKFVWNGVLFLTLQRLFASAFSLFSHV